MLRQHLGFLGRACHICMLPFNERLYEESFTKIQKRFRQFFSYIFGPVLFIYIQCVYWVNLINSESFLQTIICVCCITTSTMVFFNFFSLYNDSALIDDYFSSWSDILSESEDLLKEYITRYLKLPKLLLENLFLVQFLALCVYIIPAIYGIFIHGDGEIFGLPDLIITANNTRFLKVAAISIFTLGAWYVLVEGMVIHLLLTTMILLQVSMLTYLERELAQKEYCSLDDSKLGRFWRIWLRRHQQCLRLCEKVKRVSSLVLLMEFFGILIFASFMGIFILRGDNQYSFFIRINFALVPAPWMILLCWICNCIELLEDKHRTIFKRMYTERMIDSRYVLDQMIIKARCDKQIKFSAMNLFVVSNHMFKEYVKLVYSLFIALINIGFKTTRVSSQ